MTGALIRKELKLAAHPTEAIFLWFGVMLWIPNYPAYVPFLYVCLSIFFIFLNGRETKDVTFTALLPVRKADVVRAHVIHVALFELASIVVSVPFALLRPMVLGMPNMAGIEANLAFYGLLFGMFGVFHGAFIPMFYRSAYKVGTPFIAASTLMCVYFTAAELPVWLGTGIGAFLDSPTGERLGGHLAVFAGGFAVWALSLWFSFRRGAANFARVDL
jgi:hypothetical protein